MPEKRKSTLDIANAQKNKPLTREDIMLPVLAAWAHEEISIGRARELLHWPDDKIRLEAKRRVSNAVKLREERERLESERDNLERARGNLSMMIQRLMQRIPQDDPLYKQAELLLDRVGVVYTCLREDK